jgi:nucleoside-diphosphate-sugar epimerase
MHKATKKPLLTRDMALRMLADTFMVNVAVLSALAMRYMWILGVETGAGVNPQVVLREYGDAYLKSFWILTLVSLLVFSVNGFYTYGRMYRSSYKALIIAESVALSYLIFGFLAFLLPDVIDLPRSVPLLAWALTLLFVLGARLWTMVWDRLRHHAGQPSSAVPAAPPATVLVIGGAGYIGSALLPKLIDRGYRVRLLDLFLFGRESIGPLLNHPRLEIIQADFRQVDRIVEAMRGVEAVIHLGAIVGDPACALDEELTIEVNLMATRMIAEVAKGSGVKRFVFASTCSVYGASDVVLDEHSQLNPVSLYAHSKLASEQVLLKLADERFAPTILRFGTIHGISGRTRFDLVVNLLAAKAVTDGQVTVFGGDQWRPFLHVDDAALSVFTALEAPLELVRNEIFNVGSNSQNYTIQQVGEIIHGLVPSAQLIAMPTDGDRRNYRVNFNKIHNILGFESRWTVEQGARQVLEVMRSGQVNNYRDAKHSNVKFLSEEGVTLLSRESRWAEQLLSQAPGVAALEPASS